MQPLYFDYICYRSSLNGNVCLSLTRKPLSTPENRLTASLSTKSLLAFRPAPSRHIPSQHVDHAASSKSGAAEDRELNSENAANLMMDGNAEGQSFGEECNDSSGSLSGPPHKVSPIPAAGKKGRTLTCHVLY